MDSAKLLDKASLPEKLIIIGGGYIGSEFAQVYRRFGSAVTLIQGADQLMPREDKDVASAIQAFLEEEGVEIICNAKARTVKQNAEGIQLVVSVDGKDQTIQGTDLLIATGKHYFVSYFPVIGDIMRTFIKNITPFTIVSIVPKCFPNSGCVGFNIDRKL